MSIFKKHVMDLLSGSVEIDESLIEIPPDPALGDYAVPCFSLAKAMKNNPKSIAKALAEEIRPNRYISRIESTGPYVNFFVNRKEYMKVAVRDSLKSPKPVKERAMIEFCQVNTHKSFHVGHLRGTFLGAAISNIMEESGFKVVRANYQGDIGAHVAKVIWYLDKYKPEHPKEHKGRWLGQIYQKANAVADDNREEISSVLQKLETGDRVLTSLWKKTRQWSLDDFSFFYNLVGVRFDHYFFESEMEKPGKKIVQELLDKGIAQHSQGAVIIDLGKLGNFLLLKSDGTALYSTKDLALARIKFKKYRIGRSVYVVGAEQRLYFQQIFATLEKMGFSQAKKCVHVPFSLVNLMGGKISSREGELIYAEELVEDVIKDAEKEILQRHEKLSAKEVSARARKIGLAAVKFSFLYQDNNKEIIFDKKKSLSFEGETGPYIQYTYARMASIIRKAGRFSGVDFPEVNDAEHNIAVLLQGYRPAADEACRNYSPSAICKYLLGLCHTINRYYHETPVLKAEPGLRNARLQLLSSAKGVLAAGMALLGIDTLESM